MCPIADEALAVRIVARSATRVRVDCILVGSPSCGRDGFRLCRFSFSL